MRRSVAAASTFAARASAPSTFAGSCFGRVDLRGLVLRPSTFAGSCFGASTFAGSCFGASTFAGSFGRASFVPLAPCERALLSEGGAGRADADFARASIFGGISDSGRSAGGIVSAARSSTGSPLGSRAPRAAPDRRTRVHTRYAAPAAASSNDRMPKTSMSAMQGGPTTLHRPPVQTQKSGEVRART